MTRRRLRTLIAAATLASVALWLVAFASGGATDRTAPLTQSLALPDMPQPLGPLGLFSATLTRPLFNPARRPAPHPASQNQAPDQSSPVAALLAVAIGPDRSVAVLKMASGANRVMLQGEAVDGWTLSRVAADRVQLRAGDRQAELMLPAYPQAPNGR